MALFLWLPLSSCVFGKACTSYTSLHNPIYDLVKVIRSKEIIHNIFKCGLLPDNFTENVVGQETGLLIMLFVLEGVREFTAPGKRS